MFKDTKAFSGFSVDDLAKAKAFYEKILGIEVIEIPQGLELHFSGNNPIFVYAKPNHVPANYTILNFPVDNINETVDELAKLGVQFEHYSGALQTDEKGILRGLAANRGPDIAWFKDPAGNILSVLQDKA